MLVCTILKIYQNRTEPLNITFNENMPLFRISKRWFIPVLMFLGCNTKGVVSFSTPSPVNTQQPYRNILILDHININHQKERHDLLKAFYFDFLQCGIDVSSRRMYTVHAQSAIQVQSVIQSTPSDSQFSLLTLEHHRFCSLVKQKI
jgi:hypothetical protein